MKHCCCLLFFIFFPGLAGADVFKINDPSKNDPGFQEAVSQDSRGFYFTAGLDMDLTSQYDHKAPFEYKSDPVRRLPSRQIDLGDTTIRRQIPNLARSINKVDMERLINRVSASPLMMYQYASPAAADLLKFYYTVAQLKLGMMYEDLRLLEENSGGDVQGLLERSELDCLQKKLQSGVNEKDIVDLMVSCRAGGPLGSLNQGAGGNIIEQALNRMNAPRDVADGMREILPKYRTFRVNNGDEYYQVQGPPKRIGEVLAQQRQKFLDELDTLLKDYERNKGVDAESLQQFSQPGAPFIEQDLRELLMLPDEKRQLALRHLASEAAFIQTGDRYSQALEWMRRAAANPYFEGIYKRIYLQAADFLEAEKHSLQEKREQLKGYAAAIGSLLDASDAERLSFIAGLRQQRARKSHKENVLENRQ